MGQRGADAGMGPLGRNLVDRWQDWMLVSRIAIEKEKEKKKQKQTVKGWVMGWCRARQWNLCIRPCNLGIYLCYDG
jgi:hypothetical protein